MKTRTINALMGTRYTEASAPAMCALIEFAAQNPGLEFANYGNWAAYGQEARNISADWRAVKAVLMECAAEGVTDAQVIAAAPHAFSGRLEWRPPGLGICRWYYCAGQYFPTEYRKAVRAVLEGALSIARRSRPAVVQMPTTIAELRALNQANGGHWFDGSSMRFFGTRIESGVIGGKYFVTSEQPPDGPRGFTLRVFNDQGEVDTVGEVCEHATKAAAIAAIPAEVAS